MRIVYIPKKIGSCYNCPYRNPRFVDVAGTCTKTGKTLNKHFDFPYWCPLEDEEYV